MKKAAVLYKRLPVLVALLCCLLLVSLAEAQTKKKTTGKKAKTPTSAPATKPEEKKPAEPTKPEVAKPLEVQPALPEQLSVLRSNFKFLQEELKPALEKVVEIPVVNSTDYASQKKKLACKPKQDCLAEIAAAEKSRYLLYVISTTKTKLTLGLYDAKTTSKFDNIVLPLPLKSTSLETIQAAVEKAIPKPVKIETPKPVVNPDVPKTQPPQPTKPTLGALSPAEPKAKTEASKPKKSRGWLWISLGSLAVAAGGASAAIFLLPPDVRFPTPVSSDFGNFVVER
jgi:hypothetical protein